MLSGVVAVGLAACGDTPTATPAPQPTATTAAQVEQPTASTATGSADTASTDANGSTAGGEQEVKITLKEWAIEPSNIEVSAGKVKFVVTNSGNFAHDVAF